MSTKTNYSVRAERIMLPSKYSDHLILLCNLSRIIYNTAQYKVTNEFNISGWNYKSIGFFPMSKWIKKHSEYGLWKATIGAKTCEQILRMLNTDWITYFKALKAWKEDPSKFEERPNPPGYKYKFYSGKKLYLIPLAAQSLRFDVNTNLVHTPKYFGISVVRHQSLGYKLRGTRIKPVGNKQFEFELLYAVPERKLNSQPQRVASIDLGVNNLVTLVTNLATVPCIIPGGPVKSTNQYYNKERAKLQRAYETYPEGVIVSKRKLERLTKKRNSKISDYFHKSSRSIVNYCVSLAIDTIVIGKNNGWKQNVKMGKKNNQNFVFIPFNKLISQIKYKAEQVGIQVIVIEEPYTSKCSFIDYEYPDKQQSYVGKRGPRGRFTSADGTKEVFVG